MDNENSKKLSQNDYDDYLALALSSTDSPLVNQALEESSLSKENSAKK